MKARNLPLHIPFPHLLQRLAATYRRVASRRKRAPADQPLDRPLARPIWHAARNRVDSAGVTCASCPPAWTR
jgi:hypothetical protein